MSAFTETQTVQLLKAIAPQRVLKDAGNHSHVSQQDITAHLIRVFGFGAFDTEILDAQCVFETERLNPDGKGSGRWDVCYRALLRLTVRDEHGVKVCSYEDGSTALAQNQARGAAHDLAYKSALSLSKKRAAINLGDQFGLSLYNRGQTSALVKGTLVGTETHDDVQEGVEQQVSLGNDEIESLSHDDDLNEMTLAVDALDDARKASLKKAWGEAQLPKLAQLSSQQAQEAWALVRMATAGIFDAPEEPEETLL